MHTHGVERIVIVCLLATLLALGCAGVESRGDKSAEQLINEGMAQFNNKKYKKSLSLFQELKDWHPLSKYVILAELKSADAQFQLKAYDEAVIAYEEFEELHPKNEAIPYIIYQIGRSHYEQIDSVDRDQRATRNALKAFQKLIKHYPDSPYAMRSRDLISDCNEALAGHDMYVGLFYYKSKHYKAALSRFKRVLVDYPEGGHGAKAREYIRRCEKKIQKRQVLK